MALVQYGACCTRTYPQLSAQINATKQTESLQQQLPQSWAEPRTVKFPKVYLSEWRDLKKKNKRQSHQPLHLSSAVGRLAARGQHLHWRCTYEGISNTPNRGMTTMYLSSLTRKSHVLMSPPNLKTKQCQQ